MNRLLSMAIVAAACVCVASCSEVIGVRVVNNSGYPIHDVKLATLKETIAMETVQPGETVAKRWTLQGSDVSDGEYRWSFRGGIGGTDTVSKGFGYYTNGYIDANKIFLAVNDTTYNIVVMTNIVSRSTFSIKIGVLMDYDAGHF